MTAEADPPLPRSPWPWLAVAAAGGAVWGLAFGRQPWNVASWVALTPLLLCLGAPGGRRRAALLGFVYGLAAWLVAIPWIAPTLQTFGGLPVWLSWLSVCLLCAYLAAFHAVFAALGRDLWRAAAGSRRRPAAALLALLVLPALWVALEWLRTWLLGGFPWNLAAYAWVEVPGALPTSAWIGAYGVSFLLLFANTGVALSAARGGPWLAPRRWATAAVAVLLPLLLLATGARWGDGGSWERHSPLAPYDGGPVRLLQPNIPNAVRPDWGIIRHNYAQVLETSQRACTPGALVVWPESAAWPYSFTEDAGFRRDVLTQARSGGCTLFFNSIHPAADGGGYYNSAYVVDPEGGVARYDKRKLVPFGEYVPFAGLFPFLDKLARAAGDFFPAAELSLLPWRPGRGEGRELLGGAICYEVVFPGQVAEAVRAGATILVTITNDAWYGDTAAPWQHYAAARFRAAESRRPLLRAAITGVSAVLAPDGSERARLDPFERGVIEANVAGRTQLSPYTRVPWAVPLACTVLFVAGWVVATLRWR